MVIFIHVVCYLILMAHRFEGDFNKLDNKRRREILPPENILREIGVKQGDVLIDFGCGIGYFTTPALDFVGDEGRVIAIDTSERMLDELKKRAGARENLEIIKSDKIIDVKADYILLVNVLHEIESPKEFLSGCFESLSENGKVVVIDWQKKEADLGPPVNHRISKEEVVDMAKKQHIEKTINENFYFIEFTA
ncbi:MAG: class I SAM-dependent methyltransferase [Methanocellales archaeon]|nr:class I SAM-dependent methyltransferase [Methanocellales archaeon]